MEGAAKRLRPKFMTFATITGLVPILWSTGTGSQIMKRIAAPMIGGICTSFCWSYWFTQRFMQYGVAGKSRGRTT